MYSNATATERWARPVALREHPLQDLYQWTHKARLLQVLIDHPDGVSALELVITVFGSDTTADRRNLQANITSLRGDLPAGWNVASAVPYPHKYKLIRVE